MTNETYYETMYILRPDIPEEEVENHLKKYSELLLKEKVEVLDNQMRGKRRLAYPIKKHKEGIYVQLSHQGEGKHIAVLEKAMRLSEDVIRYLTVIQNGPLPTPKPTPEKEAPSKKATDAKDEESKEKKKVTDVKDEAPKESKKVTDVKDEAPKESKKVADVKDEESKEND